MISTSGEAPAGAGAGAGGAGEINGELNEMLSLRGLSSNMSYAVMESTQGLVTAFVQSTTAVRSSETHLCGLISLSTGTFGGPLTGSETGGDDESCAK
jgi:hypothetical protein